MRLARQERHDSEAHDSHEGDGQACVRRLGEGAGCQQDHPLQDHEQGHRHPEGPPAQVRGHGLMVGIELDRACGDIVKRALARGLLVNVTSDKTIRLVPPLVMKEAEARQLIDGLVPVVKEFLAES